MEYAFSYISYRLGIKLFDKFDIYVKAVSNVNLMFEKIKSQCIIFKYGNNNNKINLNQTQGNLLNQSKQSNLLNQSKQLIY